MGPRKGLNNLKLGIYLMHPPLFSQVLWGHLLSLAISQYYTNHNIAPYPLLQIPLGFLPQKDTTLNQEKREVRQRVWSWGHSWKYGETSGNGGHTLPYKGGDRAALKENLVRSLGLPLRQTPRAGYKG